MGKFAAGAKEMGDMLGPLLIGLLAQWLGIRAGFIICGSLGFLALGLLGLVHERGEPA